MRRSFLLAAMLAASGCSAQDGAPSGPAGWAPLFRVSDMTTLMDTARIATSGSGTQLWFGAEYAQPQPSPYREGGQFERMESLITVDCAGQSYVMHEMRILMDGREVHSEDLPDDVKPFAGDGFGPTMRVMCRLLQARGQGQMKSEIERVYQAIENRPGAAP